jgi:hypothetical protein
MDFTEVAVLISLLEEPILALICWMQPVNFSPYHLIAGLYNLGGT